MNTDNDGSSKKLTPLEDLTQKKLNDILKQLRLYRWICLIENNNKTSSNFQKLLDLNKELSLFEHSLAFYLIDGVMSVKEATIRGFKTDYVLSAIKKYIISQEKPKKIEDSIETSESDKIKELAI